MSETVRIGRVDVALSDWHSGTLRPWEPGVYKRADPAGPFSCWNGHEWRRDAGSPVAAARQTLASAHTAVAWRGLAAPSGRFCATCRGHTVVDRGVHPGTGEDLLMECPDCD